MKKRLLYIVLLIMTGMAYAQLPSNWKYDSTSKSCLFNFTSISPIIDGSYTTPKTNSDALALFALNPKSKTYECVGYGLISNTNSILIKAYAPDTAHANGFTEGASYQIMYWNSAANCQTRVRGGQNTPLILQKDSVIVIDTLRGTTPSIYYSPTSFFTTGDDASPVNTGNVPVTYSYSNTSLLIDSINGVIDVKRSVPNRYTIQLKSSYCLTTNTANISILADTTKRNADSLIQVNKTNSSCTTGGIITIKIKSKGIKWTQFDLNNTTTGNSLSSSAGTFENLQDGIYSLSALDSSGTHYYYSTSQLIARPEDCQNPIIAPDSKNGLQTLYIKEEGVGKILDNEGKTVKDLGLPGEWDAQDNKGNPVPMGDYYLFINGQQSKIITVIR